jgi:lipid-A-disaccharide synthase
MAALTGGRGARDRDAPRIAPRIALIAGEASGDNLGAKLIDALHTRRPEAEFFGIAGPRMEAAGCEVWEPAARLSVMGLFEVLPHLPRLLRIRHAVIERLLRERPDVFVGVDFKEFNLSVAARLKRAGLRTVQYVSPQVWAWRPGRVRKIDRAVDLILCLLPFEQRFYADHQVRAEFVGHPLADEIPLEIDRAAAVRTLGLQAGVERVALLPGSRQGELQRLGPDFARTVAWLGKARPRLQFVAAMAGEPLRRQFGGMLRGAGAGDAVQLIDGHSQQVMAASDVVLVASGTATLEAMLVKRPMVVAYRLGRLTSFLLRDLGLMRAPFFAQPNLLAGRRLVPEYFNEQVTPDVLGPAVLEQLERSDRPELVQTFTELHSTLRRDASARAAEAILELMDGVRSCKHR